MPVAQWIRAQAAIDLIVFTNPAANQIKADVGGSLKIESLADQSSFTSNQKSANASISVPVTGAGSFGGSVGASKSNVDSNFKSVGQQSGLKAGDGGFEVTVNNNTSRMQRRSNPSIGSRCPAKAFLRLRMTQLNKIILSWLALVSVFVGNSHKISCAKLVAKIQCDDFQAFGY